MASPYLWLLVVGQNGGIVPEKWGIIIWKWMDMLHGNDVYTKIYKVRCREMPARGGFFLELGSSSMPLLGSIGHLKPMPEAGDTLLLFHSISFSELGHGLLRLNQKVNLEKRYCEFNPSSLGMNNLQ